MEKQLVKIFQAAKYESAINLPDKIWRAIAVREAKTSKIKLWVLSFIGLFSLVGLVPAFQMLFRDFTQSGFSEYFSLLFGGGSLASYWRELALSLAESLPALSIIATLSLFFIFFLSMRYLMKQVDKNQLALIN